MFHKVISQFLSIQNWFANHLMIILKRSNFQKLLGPILIDEIKVGKESIAANESGYNQHWILVKIKCFARWLKRIFSTYTRQKQSAYYWYWLLWDRGEQNLYWRLWGLLGCFRNVQFLSSLWKHFAFWQFFIEPWDRYWYWLVSTLKKGSEDLKNHFCFWVSMNPLKVS